MKTFKYIFFAALLVASCSSEPAAETQSTETAQEQTGVTLNAQQIKNAGIQLGTAKKQKIGYTIYANGTIDVPPQNKTIISVPFGGFVKTLKVLDGMHVTKGQVLLTIEDPELIQLQQDYLEVVSNLDYLKAEMDRQQTLVQQEAGSLKALQSAKAQYNSALARKNGLKAKLEMAGISIGQLQNGTILRSVPVTAPFHGVVTKVAVNVGAYAQPTDHLLEIIDLQHAHAEVTVFERDVRYLKLGQPVTITLDSDPQPLQASVFLIGREIGQDRTVKVHCHLKNENASIAPGSYFKAAIDTGEKEYECVPSEAVVDLNGKKVVFFPSKTENGSTTYVPEEVRVLAEEDNVSAIEFKNKARSFSESMVVSGAYNIVSVLLLGNE